MEGRACAETGTENKRSGGLKIIIKWKVIIFIDDKKDEIKTDDVKIDIFLMMTMLNEWNGSLIIKRFIEARFGND